MARQNGSIINLKLGRSSSSEASPRITKCFVITATTQDHTMVYVLIKGRNENP
jgi:hypothetical protein